MKKRVLLKLAYDQLCVKWDKWVSLSGYSDRYGEITVETENGKSLTIRYVCSGGKRDLIFTTLNTRVKIEIPPLQRRKFLRRFRKNVIKRQKAKEAQGIKDLLDEL